MYLYEIRKKVIMKRKSVIIFLLIIAAAFIYSWLMYLRNPEDAGFSSRNPQYNGNGDETLELILNNGQRDEYPLSFKKQIFQNSY